MRLHRAIGIVLPQRPRRIELPRLMRAQMDADVPVLSAVLTPHHFHNSAEHQSFFEAHFVDKGREVARAAVAVLSADAALAAVA